MDPFDLSDVSWMDRRGGCTASRARDHVLRFLTGMLQLSIFIPRSQKSGAGLSGQLWWNTSIVRELASATDVKRDGTADFWKKKKKKK